MTNKYYTPQIEDIHVGYEYELSMGDPHRGGDGTVTWKKWTLNEPDPFLGWRLDGFKKAAEIGLIRTPYLNEDQILQEGFEVFGKSELGWCFTKNNTIILYDPEYIWLKIIPKDPSLLENDRFEYRYSGECPSINEFRQLCKLLNI